LIIDAFGELRDQLEQVKEDLEVCKTNPFIGIFSSGAERGGRPSRHLYSGSNFEMKIFLYINNLYFS
jgi:hypothetical protein